MAPLASLALFLREPQAAKLAELLRGNLKTVRAYPLRTSSSGSGGYQSPYRAGRFLREWCKQAMRSRLAPMEQVARMLCAREEPLPNWFRAKGTISAGAIEGLNDKLKLTVIKTHGFHSEAAVKTALCHRSRGSLRDEYRPRILQRRKSIMSKSMAPPPAASPSLLERLIERLARVVPPSVLMCTLFALGVTAVAGYGALHLSRHFYANAPFHHDSDIYRMRAVDLYELRSTQGVWAAFLQSLSQKDSLDLSIRVLLAPTALRGTHGHLVALLPFLALCLFQLSWFVFTRTRSLPMALAVPALMLAFEIIYNPVIRGIADYSPDVIATWILADMEMAWLLSRNLSIRKWSFVSGLCFGFLVMQRSALAVAGSFVLFPLFFWAVYRRLASDGWRRSLAKISCFVVPAVAIGGLTVALRWRELYDYYLHQIPGAFNAADRLAIVVNSYLSEIPVATNFILVILAAVLGVCLPGLSSSERQGGEILTAVWMIVAIPLFFIGVLRTAVANMVFVYLPPTLVILLATAVPRLLPARLSRPFAKVLLTLALVSTVVQYHLWSQGIQASFKYQAPSLTFYHELEGLVMAQPEPRTFGLILPEINETVWNHFYHDRRTNLRPTTYLYSVDSWYQGAYGTVSPPEIIRTIREEQLEQTEGTLALVNCDRDAVVRAFFSVMGSLTGEQISEPCSLQVALGLYDYLMDSPHWRAIQKMKSPYGDLYALQYTKSPMGMADKWSQLERAITDIPLIAAPDAAFWVYDYASKCPPRFKGGLYCQSLPAGKGGLKLVVFSGSNQDAMLHAKVLPESSPEQPAQTLVIATKKEKQEFKVQKAQELLVSLHLGEGMNGIDVYVAEDPSAPPDESTSRLTLESPRLVRVRSD